MRLPPLLNTRNTLLAWHMFRGGWRTDEIARVMHVTEAEVANSLHRLREMLHRGYRRRTILYPNHKGATA